MRNDPGVGHMLRDARLSQIDKEKCYPGGWKETTLDLLETWYHACVRSSDKHAEAARACRQKFRMISIPTIIIGTAATAMSFFSAGGDCGSEGEDSAGLKYGVAILTSLVSILTATNSLYDFHSKTQEHISTSNAFANLARRTSLQIFLDIASRSPAQVVLTDVSAEFASISNNSPLI